MTYEHDAQHSYETLSSVRRRIEKEIAAAGSLMEYLNTLDAEYAITEERRGERAQLRRVAQFITRSGDNLTQESLSFIYGSMLGAKVTSYLYKNDEAGRGLAQAYYQDRYKEFDERTRDDLWRSPPRQRMELFAASLNDDLMHGVGSKLPGEYEDLIFDWSTELADEAELDPHYLIIGFRMITGQAIDTDSLELKTEELLEEFESAAPELPHYRSGDLRQLSEPRFDHAQEIIDFLDLRLPVTEDLTMARSAIVRHAHLSKKPFTPEDLSDVEQIQAIQEHIANALNDYNEKHRFIEPNEDLIAYGEFQLRMTDTTNGHEVRGLVTLDNLINGTFQKFVVYDAPSQQSISQAILALEHESDAASLIAFDEHYMPAIRLTNISIVSDHNSEKPRTVDVFPNTVVDIPISYRNVVFERFVEE